MPSRLLLGLLVSLVFCSLGFAQEYGPPAGPEYYYSYPASPVGQLPAAEAMPPANSWPLPVAQDNGTSTPAVTYYDPPVFETALEPAAPVAVVCTPKLWEGSFELGLDGSEGNTQTFNYRLGFDAKRTGPIGVFSVAMDYLRKSNQSDETAHRGLLDLRHEWPFADSPWSFFVHGTTEYDEFKQFDVRVSADAGLGYQIIDTEWTTLAARAGGGFSHEIGGPDDEYVPEAVFGLEFEHQLTDRQKLTALAEFMPNVTNFNDYRVNARAGWEALIDEAHNLSLRLGVHNRHDSTPNGAKPNDLEYTATLIWKF